MQKQSATWGNCNRAPFRAATKWTPLLHFLSRNVAFLPNVTPRHAQAADLPAIVAIYNASIPGRTATADTEPVSVSSREGWFAEFDPARRPLWVLDDADGRVAAWLSVRSFYGRPAYHRTAEIGVYTAPAVQRRGLARVLAQARGRDRPRRSVSRRCSPSCSATTRRASRCSTARASSAGARFPASRSSTAASATSPSSAVACHDRARRRPDPPRGGTIRRRPRDPPGTTRRRRDAARADRRTRRLRAARASPYRVGRDARRRDLRRGSPPSRC